jgi:hypothetical protein
MVASHESSKQREDTKANCIKVSVAGLSRALRIDFDDVLVRAEDVYHMRQRICNEKQYNVSDGTGKAWVKGHGTR